MRHTVRSSVRLAVLALLLVAGLAAQAQSAPVATPGAEDESEIRDVMAKSAADWNKGDLAAFATSYKNSPDTLFIGNKVSRGYYGMLESYKKSYATPAARGTLTYSNLEVHPLDAHFAVVLGNCHLERTAAGGGSYDCIYSLVFEKTAAGWKIVVDHSSALTPPAPPAPKPVAKH